MADFERRRRRHRHGAPTERPDGGPAGTPRPAAPHRPPRRPDAADPDAAASASTAEVHDPEPDDAPERDGRPVPGPRPQSPGPRVPEPAQRTPEPAQRIPEPPPTHRHRRQTSGRSASAGGHGDDRDADRGLRGLVGSGTSQVSTSAALRARDASRPGADDLAAAEETLTIVRRHWVPREELPRRER